MLVFNVALNTHHTYLIIVRNLVTGPQVQVLQITAGPCYSTNTVIISASHEQVQPKHKMNISLCDHVKDVTMV